MLFTHDTAMALQFAQALVNSHPDADSSGRDTPPDPAALDALLTEWDYSGRRDGDLAELGDVWAVRERLSELWHLERDAMVEAINGILADATASPRLVRHDSLDWHIHATDSEAPLAQRIVVEAAMALVDVVRADATDRLRDCAADDCAGVFVDLSKNGSKLFCSTRCANRVHARAHRDRRHDAP